MYVTGSATDLADLMTKIKDFCINSSSGYPAYTLNNFSTENTGHRLHITKNGCLFNLRSVVNENLPVGGSTNAYGIYMNAGTGSYNSGSAWYDQVGVFKYNSNTNYLISGINKITSSIVSYHFFYFKETNNYDAIYIVVESPSGSYQRLMFGLLDSTSVHSDWGTAPPKGMFYSGSVSHSNANYSMSLSFLGGSDSLLNSGSPSGAIYGTFPVTSGSYTGWISGDFSVPQNQMGAAIPQTFDMSLKMGSILLCSPNTFNSMPPLLPLAVCATAGTTTTMGNTTPWYPVGSFPFLYLINIFNISPGATITIGSDTYKVFPFRKKSDTWVFNSPDNGTYRFGFAIKTS